MSDRKSMDEWQLQESPESGDQWQLLDQEQELSEDLKLQDAAPGANPWQPVAYEEPPARRTGWILPTFIIAALLAVLGYIGWLAMNGFDIGGPAVPPPITESAESGGAEPGVVAVETQTEVPPTATSQPEPTATPQPEPTVAPTPVMVAQRVVTVLSPLGLNARLQPGGEGEVDRILDAGVTGIVVDEDDGGEWVQIELESGERFWVTSAEELVEIVTEMIELPEGEAPPAAADAPAPETTEPATEEADGVAEALTAAIEVVGGVNARSEPSAGGEVLQIVPQGTTLPIVGVNDDATWIQVTLDDGQTAWMSTVVVTLSGALDSLRATAETEATPAAAEEAEAPDEAETVPEETAVPAEEENVDPIVTIDNLIGSNARTEPSTTAETTAFVPGGSELPALGRSADNNWVQVELEDGTSAWIFSGSIVLNVPLESLPVIE